MSNKIDAYQMGRDAAQKQSSLPGLKFPLSDHKAHNAARWESELHINPFPKGSGAIKEAEGFHEEWKRGWTDYQSESVAAWYSLMNLNEEG